MTVSPGDHLALKGSLFDYMNWLKNAGFTYGPVPLRASYAIHSTKSHSATSASSARLLQLSKGLKQHIWGTLPV